MIACGYPSFFVYYEHGYFLNLDLQTGGVFLYNFVSSIILHSVIFILLIFKGNLKLTHF
jgi:hypothetical protein